MLRKTNMQKDFFDSYVYENLLPAEHILLDIKKHIDFSFVEEELKDLYTPDNGRPGYPPELLFKMLFLEFHYNLSDVEVAKQVRYNTLYRYFVGLQIHDSTPDDTTLVVFRTRCGKERFERFFNRLVNLCKEKGLLQERLKIIDATSVVADIAIPNTVNLLRQGRRVILKKISKTTPERAKALEPKYKTLEHLPRKPKEEELKEEVALTKSFVNELKDHKFAEDIETLLESLRELILPSGDKSKIVSFVDPDATNGYATSKKMFTGYKAHIAQDESEIVTSTDTLQAHQNEGAQLSSILEKEQNKQIKSEAVAADSAYSSYENRTQIHTRQMKAYIPKRKSNTKIERLGFKYLPEEDILVCPQGCHSTSKIRQTCGELYCFLRKLCRLCSKHSLCQAQNTNGCVRILVSDDYKEHLKDHDDYYFLAQRRRKGIERKIGEAKKWHGLNRARYRARWRVAIQVLMTFLVINAKRMVKLIKERFFLPQEMVLATSYG